MLIRLAQFLMVSVFATSAAVAEVQVIDGDTLELDGTTYRLEGIDAPEYGQNCSARSGADWPCGKRSLEAMVALTQGQDVTCQAGERDQYNRTIAKCFANGELILARTWFAKDLPGPF